jgi:hypothetical protein
MCKVKALSKSSGDSCAISEYVSLFAVCQFWGKNMDITFNGFLVTLGYVATLPGMESCSSFLQKSRPSRFSKYGILAPAEIQALPLRVRKISKTVTDKWFELPLDQRSEIVLLSEEVLIGRFAKPGKVVPVASSQATTVKFEEIFLRLSFKFARLVTRKNAEAEILVALRDFANAVLNQSVQDEAFTTVPPDFKFSGESVLTKGKRRRPVLA